MWASQNRRRRKADKKPARRLGKDKIRLSWIVERDTFSLSATPGIECVLPFDSIFKRNILLSARETLVYHKHWCKR